MNSPNYPDCTITKGLKTSTYLYLTMIHVNNYALDNINVTKTKMKIHNIKVNEIINRRLSEYGTTYDSKPKVLKKILDFLDLLEDVKNEVMELKNE